MMHTDSIAPYSKRNAAIDLLRALTMFTMIFVNDFWKIHDVPHWLEHARWDEDFMGLADVVFPCFLFAVGMSIPYAIERRYAKGLSGESTIKHILSRSFALIVMGAFISNSEARLSAEVPYSIGIYWIVMVVGFICIWNQYPRTDSLRTRRIYIALKVIGTVLLLYLALTFRSEDGGNLFGAHWSILGAIGWIYLLCAMIYVYTRDRLKYLVPWWILFAVICVLSSRLRPELGGEALLALSEPNFYNSALSTLHIDNGCLPAFTMGGIIFSIIGARRAQPVTPRFTLYAALAMVLFLLAGLLAHRYWIVSKIVATPPWLCYVTAIAIALYTLFAWVERAGKTAWFNPIKPAGTATLTTYLIPYLAYALADITGYVLPDWFTHGIMGIVNCLAFAFVIIGVTWLLGKMHVKLKV
ncbi:MAG: DUF5009 domain-containing protein [Mediterranea sp.]|jgi:predicted acyltransferase|nr:DUF5009 domain-containing protein [Mediterranea sp.]